MVLRTLSPAAHADFVECSEFVSLHKNELVHSAGGVGNWAYFPVSGALGGFTSGVEGARVQVMLVGRDGMVGGLRAILGIEQATLSVRVALAGEAFALPTGAVQGLTARHPDFREAIERCALRMIQDSIQSVLCASRHALVERVSTWLLIMSDHSTPREIVLLTHRELAEIVGSGRSSLSVVVSELTCAGLIEPGGRGRLLINDAERLAALACECLQLSCLRAPSRHVPDVLVM